MENRNSLNSQPERNRLLYTILIVLAVGYLAQLASPLRLHPDTVVLLSMADSAAHGGGFLYYGHPTVFPPAYPALVALLLKLHIAHPWVLVGVNFVYLFIGLYAVSRILQQSFFSDSSAVLGVCALCLLSFVVIRHFTMPLTDIGFFGLAMCALAAMESALRSREGHFWFSLMTAVGLVVVAVAQRWIGMALIPALLWTAASHPGVRRKAMLVLNWRVVVSAVIIASLTGFTIFRTIGATSTLNDFHRVWAYHARGELETAVLPTRVTELAEIAINLPQSALPPSMRRALPLIGLSFFALVLFGVATKGRRFGPTETFFVAYVGVLFGWPFYDPRFWLPVIPFLLAYMGLAVSHFKSMPRRRLVAASYLGVYAGLGFMVLVASTKVAFSGSKFPDVYENDIYQGTYCVVFRSCGTNRLAVNDAALHVLQTYR